MRCRHTSDSDLIDLSRGELLESRQGAASTALLYTNRVVSHPP